MLAYSLLFRNNKTVTILNTNSIRVPEDQKNTHCLGKFSVTCHQESTKKDLYLTTKLYYDKIQG